MRPATKPDELGVIKDDETYPTSVFMKRAGIGRHAFTSMRRQGLKVCKTNGRCYVRGCDFSAWLSQLQDAS